MGKGAVRRRGRGSRSTHRTSTSSSGASTELTLRRVAHRTGAAPGARGVQPRAAETRMNRSELAHILRAAGKIAEDPDILVIGSQSILGSYDERELPDEATRSIEADIAYFDDRDDE